MSSPCSGKRRWILGNVRTPPLAAVSSELTFTRRSGERVIRLHLWFLQNFGCEICLIIKPGIGLELQEVQEWEQSGDPTFYGSNGRQRRSYRHRGTLKRLNG